MGEVVTVGSGRGAVGVIVGVMSVVVSVVNCDVAKLGVE